MPATLVSSGVTHNQAALTAATAAASSSVQAVVAAAAGVHGTDGQGGATTSNVARAGIVYKYYFTYINIFSIDISQKISREISSLYHEF